MFAAQTQYQHLGIMQGGITTELDEKVILSDLWVFDFTIHRWVEIPTLNRQHQIPQFYGHTIEIYHD